MDVWLNAFFRIGRSRRLSADKMQSGGCRRIRRSREVAWPRRIQEGAIIEYRGTGRGSVTNSGDGWPAARAGIGTAVISPDVV